MAIGVFAFCSSMWALRTRIRAAVIARVVRKFHWVLEVAVDFLCSVGPWAIRPGAVKWCHEMGIGFSCRPTLALRCGGCQLLKTAPELVEPMDVTWGKFIPNEGHLIRVRKLLFRKMKSWGPRHHQWKLMWCNQFLDNQIDTRNSRFLGWWCPLQVWRPMCCLWSFDFLRYYHLQPIGAGTFDWMRSVLGDVVVVHLSKSNVAKFVVWEVSDGGFFHKSMWKLTKLLGKQSRLADIGFANVSVFE